MPSASSPPPLSVLRALSVPIPPFKPSSTRRDLSTSFRAFTAAWTALSQVSVLPAVCSRLGERAAEVLVAVEGVLREVEEKEREERGGKVVLERSYEFQGGGGGRREASEGGEAGQGAGGGGSTIFKVQATLLDLQMFATDFLATSSTSRLSLLVDNLPTEQKKLRTLTSSLLSCISTYSLSALSTASWADEDAADLAADEALLPRLFQLSIALRGPVYDAFLASLPDTAATHETPGKKRTAFVEWCLARNPLLRPKDGAASPAGSTIRRGSKSKATWPPPAPTASADVGIGLGFPKALYSSPLSGRRAASQPADLGAVDPPSPPPFSSLALPKLKRADTEPALAIPPPSPASAAPAVSSPPTAAPEASGTSPVEPSAPLARSTGVVRAASEDETSVDGTVPPSEKQEAESPLEEGVKTAPEATPLLAESAESSVELPVEATAPLPSPSIVLSLSDPTPPLSPSPAAVPTPVPTPSKPSPTPSNASLSASASDDPLLSLARRDSAASSVAMTASGSAGSRLFEEPVRAMEEETGEVALPSEAEKQELEEDKEEEEKEVEKVKVEEDVAPLLASEQSAENADELVGETTATPVGEPDAGAAGEPESEKDAEREAAESASTETNAVEAATSTPPAFDDEGPSPPPATPEGGPALQPVEEEADETTATVSVEAAAPVPVFAIEEPKDEIVQPPTAAAPAPTTPSLPSPSPASSAPSPAAPPLAPLRILSLDGCGVVGPVPQLLLLKQHLASLPSPPSPAQHFDLVVSTSASALVAILVGHLGLSVDEALATWTRIAQQAFALDLTPPAGAAQAKPKRGVWSRLFGRGGGAPFPPPRTPSVDEPTRRAQALEAALKAHLPCASEPFSGGASRIAVLAFERTGNGNRERWLSNQGDRAEHGMTVGEVVKAALAASSFFPSSSRWTHSPASLNPSASALALARSSYPISATASQSQPIFLLSLSAGYSSLSIDAVALKRLSKPRLSALREVKQLAASNAAAAAALARKAEGEEGVEVERVEVDCARCGVVEGREEWETVDLVKALVGGTGEKRPATAGKRPSIRISQVPLSPSTPLLSPSTLTPTSPTTPKSVRKRASRLSFFGIGGGGGDKTTSGSSGGGGNGPVRRASSFVPASRTGDAAPLSPLPSTSAATLAPPMPQSTTGRKGLRTSVSMDDLTRREFLRGSESGSGEGGEGGGKSGGMYGLREAAESAGSLRGT
ncbi:hypothetical protein JCM6882_008500 [Rhodosporidiobolus microsporus]